MVGRAAEANNSADSMLFLVSPTSVKSKIFDTEVNKAERLGKPILPVMAVETPINDIPRRLQRLNFSVLDSVADTATEYPLLLEALRQDFLCIPEHTRLVELAMRWDTAGRP